MTPARFRWGMILILIGLVLLLKNLDVLITDFWWDWITWLPALLIAIGIEKIFSGTRLQFISYLTSVGILAGGLYLATRAQIHDLAVDESPGSSEFVLSDNGEVNRLKIAIDVKRSNVTVRESGNEIVRARFENVFRAPHSEGTIDGGIAHVSLIGRGKEFVGGLLKVDIGEPEDWFLRFSDHIPVDLTFDGGESDIHLNLTANPVERIEVRSDQDNIYLKIGELLPAVEVHISGDRPALRLRISSGTGLRVITSEPGDYLGQAGLTEGSDGYYTDGFEEHPVKVNMYLENRLERFSLDYY